MKLKSLIKSTLLDALPKEKTNEDYMKQLKAPSSDWTYGHSHGYSQALKTIKDSLEGI